MASASYASFFTALTGHAPFPYQDRLAQQVWRDVVDIPTGLGKTAAVVVAWLWKRLNGDPETGRRLVYCLPMRTLVDQTADAATTWCEQATPLFEEAGVRAPSVHVLMGGHLDERWELEPEAPAVLIGTQDMLLSRALNRGYAMSRFKWPVHFGLLSCDALWVLDETQLMGVGVQTSAQLAAFRKDMGSVGPAHTVWMSATLGREQLSTVDHREPAEGWGTTTLSDEDHDSSLVRKRTQAKKKIAPLAKVTIPGKEWSKSLAGLADAVVSAHKERGGLTLVVVNRVARARELYELVDSRSEGVRCGLVHSRFRPAERSVQRTLLETSEERIIVATQALEAGVDVSARTMFTELAPWPSLVQRFGRCNRYGDEEDARIHWVNLEDSDDAALPYDPSELSVARDLLSHLGNGGDAGPAACADVSYAPPEVVRAVLRRRDLMDLFDTTPDILGNDVDVSRFVRDAEDTDIQVFWRDLVEKPTRAVRAPSRSELCRVSVGDAKKFLQELEKRRKKASERDAHQHRAWKWDARVGEWVVQPSWQLTPGQTLLLSASVGGYDTTLGWVGGIHKDSVPVVENMAGSELESELGADPRTEVGRWVALTAHLTHVGSEARKIVEALGVEQRWRDAVVIAAEWHDLGKAHEVFQKRLAAVAEVAELKPPMAPPFAKSAAMGTRVAVKGDRRYFRHELASALAWLQLRKDHPDVSLVAYLIAAHHGKVRLSIRSIPGETEPPKREQLFARGVWQGDVLDAVELPDGSTTASVELDLQCMQLGSGSWLERALDLRDSRDIGPFRLAFLEAVVRIADWNASRKEAAGDYAE